MVTGPLGQQGAGGGAVTLVDYQAYQFNPSPVLNCLSGDIIYYQCTRANNTNPTGLAQYGTATLVLDESVGYIFETAGTDTGFRYERWHATSDGTVDLKFGQSSSAGAQIIVRGTHNARTVLPVALTSAGFTAWDGTSLTPSGSTFGMLTWAGGGTATTTGPDSPWTELDFHTGSSSGSAVFQSSSPSGTFGGDLDVAAATFGGYVATLIDVT